MSDDRDIISELQKTGSFLMEHKLAWGTAGNISARANLEQYYISASGTYLGQLQEADLVLAPGNKTSDCKKPSKEAPMHGAIYDERPEIHAVIHSAPFYSTLLACTSLNLPSTYFVEAMYYLERIARIRYEHPGSNELAEAVREKAKEANVFFLENHGVIVCDVSIKEALMSLQTLEFTSRMLVTSLEKGIDIEGLSDDTVEDFLNNAGYKERRRWE
ncbi:class II aldolase/adducin family protein [Natribacillus halophilus]|uniref:Ribulose-5-phosphate 4-epimerase/Fuculose-1-phosphate aldolase n=1 Tax=Natribacillus halophilus TaxID=549003 RepID=A0A1G8SLH5_9BACI|nr:class II aldolase/adducin family protein [Natribacillus halophilus]SDJ30051.1 Ribulose-5-phosphate 4-epimerase/Fuculose-1-phosphate aldolase [Natribacillus halophilus]